LPINLPLLLGHRGARATKSVPENSIESFDLALTHGCDGFEFDVRLTSDRASVISHDPRLRGLTVAKVTRGEMPELPLLQEVLSRYRSRAFLDIELKVTGLESSLLMALDNNPPERGYVVSSFLPAVLSDVSARNPRIPLGLICDRKGELVLWPEMPVEYVIPHGSLVTRQLVEHIRDAGKKLLVWTVNDPATMLQLRDWGVEGIISDDTELLVRTMRRSASGN